MNSTILSSNPVFDVNTGICTIPAVALGDLMTAVQTAYLAQCTVAGAGPFPRQQLAGITVYANTAPVTILNAGTTGVGLLIPANESAYLPIRQIPSVGPRGLGYTATAPVGVVVHFIE